MFRFLHPFLFSLYPILALYASQPGLVSPKVLPLPLLFVLSLSGALFAIVAWVRGPGKAAMITSTMVMCGLMFTPTFASVASILPELSEHVILCLVIWFTWPAVVIALVLRSNTDWSGINSVLNFVAGALVAASLVQIVIWESGQEPVADVYPTDPEVRSTAAKEDGQAGDLPDIYYLVFDRYAGAATLESEYGFDNGEALEYLRSNGFYVADEARSNYLKTAQSLSSSLNLEHIDYLKELYGPDSENTRPLGRRLREHQASRYLKARGYEFLQIGSRWEPTRTNPNADVSFSRDGLSEFSRTIIRMSFLPYLSPRLGLSQFDEVWGHCDTVWRQRDSLMKVTARRGPKFVFAHVLVPHPPLAFDREGNCLSFDEVLNQDPAEGYVEQVRYANRLIREFVDRIKTASSRDPIIIIQADEGPFPIGVDDEFDWREATDAQLREKVRILNAYHLPGVDMKGVLYPHITPVNTFRMIFNLYFGEEYRLLPDTTYAHVDERHPYSFFDVTSRVEYR